jgi:hypothetical protein
MCLPLLSLTALLVDSVGLTAEPKLVIATDRQSQPEKLLSSAGRLTVHW